VAVIVMRWSRPAKTPASVRISARVCARHRLETNAQQAVAGLALDHVLGRGLRAQRLAQQRQQQREGVRIEAPDVRQARRLARGQACTRGFDLQMFLAQLAREQGAFLVRSCTLGSGPRGAASPYSRRRGWIRSGGASAHGVVAGSSLPASVFNEKCRAGLRAKAARPRRCASSSSAQLANQPASTLKSAERSLRPLRRSFSAATAASSCGIAARAFERSTSACGGS
jgi:hypothetical protein